MLTDNGPPWNSAEIKQYFKSRGIKHKKITPLWPRANGLTERFMQNINKCIRTAIAENKNWRDQLRNMLINYRNTPHTTTGYQPSELFFNRKTRNFIPDNQQRQQTSPFYENVKANQQRENERSSKYHPKSEDITFKVGDPVIMQRDQRRSKFESNFYETNFTVVAVKGTMITVESESGKQYTRNVSFFKLRKGKDVEQKDEQPIERKRYPRRQRKPVDRY